MQIEEYWAGKWGNSYVMKYIYDYPPGMEWSLFKAGSEEGHTGTANLKIFSRSKIATFGANDYMFFCAIVKVVALVTCLTCITENMSFIIISYCKTQ